VGPASRAAFTPAHPWPLPSPILRRLSSTSQRHAAPCSAWLLGALARQPRRSGWHVRAVRTVGRRPVWDAGAGAAGGAAPKEYRKYKATFHAVPPARVRPPPATLLPLVPAPGVGPPVLPPWHTPGQGVARSAPRQRRARAGGHRPARRRSKQGQHHHRRWGCCYAFVAWELLVMRASFRETAFPEAFPPWHPTALPHPAQPVRK